MATTGTLTSLVVTWPELSVIVASNCTEVPFSAAVGVQEYVYGASVTVATGSPSTFNATDLTP